VTFNVIRKVESSVELYHLFWSLSEIESSLEMREDWSVPNTLIPFYGDWHDLFCLDTVTGSIIELSDDRSEVYKWKTITDFNESLIPSKDWEETPADTSGIIDSESYLDF